MVKFAGGAVPLIVRLHDVSTHGGLLHHINISYRGTQKLYNVGYESSDAIYVAACNSMCLKKRADFFFCSFIWIRKSE